MKQLLILLAIATVGLAHSQETKHQISFGAHQDLTWNSKGTSAKFDTSLNIDDYSSGEGNFAINYMHSASKHFQIGFAIDNKVEETEIKFESGSKSKSESKTTALYLLLNYNFNSDYKDSWYIGLALGQEKYTSDSEDTSGDKESSSSKIAATALMVGKRFSLEFMGIQNLTYSPMISYIKGDVSGDLEDDGIEEMGILTLDILKLDLLF